MTDLADDIEVLEGALAWLRSGHQVALATVIRTWGSSPRPPGSLLAMNDTGQFVGSVSGGCVEDSLLARYRDGELAGPAPTLEVLIEQLSGPESVAPLLARLHDGALVKRRVSLATGEVDLQQGDSGTEFQLSDTAVVKTFGPAWQLLLIGDGQLARHLASMALHLDYRVIICDPRDAFAPLEPLAGVHYNRLMPDDAVQGLSDQARTAIVTLAHDPRQDDLGLSAALESQAFYIGALGSTRSAQARRERLASLGYSAQQIERIHGPAGLHIGSKRPAEIAVSILAQITAIRNGIIQQVQQSR